PRLQPERLASCLVRLVKAPSRAVVRFFHNGAGWSSSVARWAHNPEVAGSNPVPATDVAKSATPKARIPQGIRAFWCANACADAADSRAGAVSWAICV